MSKRMLLGTTIVLSCCVAAVVFFKARNHHETIHDSTTNIAFVGNSMFYFNDFPRFFQTLASPHDIHQDCCLHGGASIPSLVQKGSGMYPQFKTPRAIVATFEKETMYDYGTCTVQQLLLGKDDNLTNPQYSSPEYKNASGHNQNPCRVNDAYRRYSLSQHHEPPLKWDYLLLNDNTANPARNASRLAALTTLKDYYVPRLLETGAIPVLLWTHAYIPSNGRDMTGLDNVANFTSLTGVGVREYSASLERHLPKAQKPRIAPVGLAFLTVYEEQPQIWKTLFHNADNLHASPAGTFLQGCIVHFTVFGSLPDILSLQNDVDVANLWKTARMMQHSWERPNPFPPIQEIRYLYEIAQRIADGHVPSTYIDYKDGEVAYEGGGR